MPEEEKQKEVKTKSYNMFQIAIIIGIVFLIVFFVSKAELNQRFWNIIIFICVVGIAFAVLTGWNKKAEEKSLEEIVRIIKFHNNQLPSPIFLDTSSDNINATETSPNQFLIHFINEGLVYEVRNNLVKGVEFTNLYNAKKDRERSSISKEIRQHQKQESAIIQRAEQLNLDVPS